ncbi:MAG: carboxymuconolactone decarboxylase family protein [Acidimicrobiales bacterium]
MNHEGLPRRTSADTEGPVAKVLSKLEATGQDLTVLRLLANSPTVFRPFVRLSSTLMYDGALPEKVREVVILWMGRNRPHSYEWIEHVLIARRVGLSDEQIDAIERDDLDGDLFTDEQRLAVVVAAQLLGDHALPPETFEAAVDTWGLETFIELVMVVGWWGGTVPTFLEAMGLRRPDVCDLDVPEWMPEPD